MILTGTKSLVYSNAVGMADLAQSAYPTVAGWYASAAAALAAVNASAACAVLESFGDVGPDKYIRATLGMSIVGTVGKTVEETDYLIYPCTLDGTEGVRLERAFSAVWTSSGTAITAGRGGRTSHCDPSLVVLTVDGVLAARTGQEALAVSRIPATIEIPDVGEAAGILRVIKLGASSPAMGCAPMIRLWR